MKLRLVPLCAAGASALALGCSPMNHPVRYMHPMPIEKAKQLPSAGSAPVAEVGNIQTIAYFYGPMPTGVTVSHTGRIFLNFPRWGDNVDYTVGELKNGKTVAYPNDKFSRYDPANPAGTLVSVQSVVVDPNDRLWILDTGSINFGNVIPQGPKLVCVDLETDQVIKTITFPPDVALPTTYLNDVRFDLRRGKGGMAFITDSAGQGPSAIIVVDLDSGQSWRRLNHRQSVQSDPSFVPVVEGQPLMQRMPGAPPKQLKMGSDGIAISADGKTLYYCPLASQHLFSVSIDALADSSKSDKQVAATVKDLGDRGFASDGLESDAQGRLYLTDYEHNGVRVRNPDGSHRFIARSNTILWPDTLSVAEDGYLYFTNNQLERMARFHGGHDLRQRPFSLLRVKIDGTPVELK